jgi:DNA-binding GntR family transcriptional regulator
MLLSVARCQHKAKLTKVSWTLARNGGTFVIQRVVLSEQVKEELLDGIMSGRFKPGDRLVESQIAKGMGISQSPVREALRDLVAMRFVEVEPHKGARVRKMDEREVVEVYPVRASLEELAGQMAVERAQTHIDDLERAVDKMGRAFRDKDPRTMAHWDVQFHRTILEAADNRILLETWNSLMIEARTYLTLSNLMVRRPDVDLTPWHYPIIEAIRSGDAVRCGAEMRKHVEDIGVVMREAVAEGTLDSAQTEAHHDNTVLREAKAG